MGGPRLEQPRTLRFVGDWGGANLHRTCGWLAMELWDRSPAGTKTWILSAAGCADNLRAVGSGEVDVAVMTPGNFARMAIGGRGPFEGEAYPYLRALGQVPHDDALLFAVRADLGVSSVEEIRDRRFPLRLALSPANGGDNPTGLATEFLLERSGIPLQALVEWGGELVFGERPNDCLDAFADGRADAVIHEAIMTPWWHDLAAGRDLRFVAFGAPALEAIEDDLLCLRRTVPAGYLRGLDETLETVDFSGYLVVVREEMADDVAYLLAWILGETASRFERNYRHFPPERSPVVYPIEREALARVPIPLHSAAERYYREAGVAVGDLATANV
jgi:TRAP-type uncharacterized transport system substrate-binding protein